MSKTKMETLLEIEGFAGKVDEFCREFTFGPYPGVPGICMNPGCDYTTQVEPDSNSGWCEICETNTVASGFILLGVI